MHLVYLQESGEAQEALQSGQGTLGNVEQLHASSCSFQ